MTFPRVRAPGTWVLGSVLAPAEMEEVDQNLSEAVDGTAGGTYAPTAPVVLGASGGNTVGLHATAHAILDDFEGHVKATYALTVESGGNVVALNGSTVTCLGLTVIADGGGAGLNGTLEIGNGFAGNGHVVVRAGSDVALNGTMAVNPDASVTFAGTAGHPASLFVTADAAAAFNGTAGHNATVLFGLHSTTTLDGATNVTSSGALTVLAGGLLALNGVTSLGAAQPAPTADPGANNLLFATNTTKAWGSLNPDGAGNVTIQDGYNVAGAVLAPGFPGIIIVTFVRPMANAHYHLSFGSDFVGLDAGANNGLVLNFTSRTINGFSLTAYNPHSWATPIDFSAGTANLYHLTFEVVGRQ